MSGKVKTMFDVFEIMGAKNKARYIEQIKANMPDADYFIELEDNKEFIKTFVLVFHMNSVSGGVGYVWKHASYTYDFDIEKFSGTSEPVKLSSIHEIIKL